MLPTDVFGHGEHGLKANFMSESKRKSESGKLFFLLVQLVSLLGSKVTHVAIGFWIYSHSRSVMDFSLVLLCSFLPNILSSFISGTIVDRLHFYKTFAVGDVVSAVVMSLSALLVFSHPQTSIFLYATIFIVSAVSALQWVALQAYLPGAFSGPNLIRATGWLSTSTALAKLGAASMASFLMATIGLGAIFLIDAATYLFSAYVVWGVLPRDNKTIPHDTGEGILSQFRDGLAYLSGQRDLFNLILLFVVLNFFAGINTNLMTPLFLERYSAKYAGYLLGFFGLGAMFAGMLQTGILSIARLRHNIPLLMMIVFIEDMLIGFFNAPPLVATLMFLLGSTIALINTCTTLVMQENIASNYRGRIFAVSRTIG